MKNVLDIASNSTSSTTVLLSGKVESDDDPSTWRDEIIEEYSYINFLNPMELGWEKYAEEGSIQVQLTDKEVAEVSEEEADELLERWRMGWDMLMIQACKRAVMFADAVLINTKPGLNTTGTHWEHCMAWYVDPKPVVTLVPEDEDSYEYLRTFTFYHSDYITSSTDDAIKMLEAITR